MLLIGHRLWLVRWSGQPAFADILPDESRSPGNLVLPASNSRMPSPGKIIAGPRRDGERRGVDADLAMPLAGERLSSRGCGRSTWHQTGYHQ
jgi:hypothetical protein